VPAPRSKEFEEDSLSSDCFIIVLRGELNGIGCSQKAEEYGNNRLHCIGWYEVVDR
jgi:hypothetical protein